MPVIGGSINESQTVVSFLWFIEGPNFASNIILTGSELQFPSSVNAYKLSFEVVIILFEISVENEFCLE